MTEVHRWHARLRADKSQQMDTMQIGCILSESRSGDFTDPDKRKIDGTYDDDNIGRGIGRALYPRFATDS
ncbi:hypothetical protein SERLA73DRAFT_145226 [Serpula lacrymans var. lacrymans S7.3]|uniref:Uncharacterized protein n=1 Tax=Serpula lacrymans var. lacrymans (strain S7.3) TaxID=936435 RepID=F8QDB3_SERL3|nr:hypothetical protein SERLA73DRAFT_145226 [Serpula lacrymans var. lacrymans S7.3]